MDSAVPTRTVHYESFWPAMVNFDFEYSSRPDAGAEEKAFSAALHRVSKGDGVGARAAFEEIFRTTTDPDMKAFAKNTLAQFYMLEADWPGFLDLTERDAVDPEAPAPSDAERYRFRSDEIEVPMGISAEGVPVIDALINGHPVKLILDTGNILTSLSSDIAEKCEVAPLDLSSLEVGTLAERNVSIKPAIIGELAIGSLVIENHPALIMDERDMTMNLLFRKIKIDGILGWNAIRNLDLEMNFRIGKAILRKPATGPRGDLFWLQYPCVEMKSIEGIPLYFGLDTGASSTSVSEKIFEKIGIKKYTASSTIGGSIGGIRVSKVKIIPKAEIRLDHYGFAYRNLKAYPYAGASLYDGILGSDSLMTGSIRLDYRSGRFEYALSD